MQEEKENLIGTKVEALNSDESKPKTETSQENREVENCDAELNRPKPKRTCDQTTMDQRQMNVLSLNDK